MENQRLFLYMALIFVALLMWSEWQRDYRQPAPTEEVVEEVPSEFAEAPEEAAPATDPERATVPSPTLLPQAETIRVVTDLLDVEINTLGGDIRSVKLREYPVTVDDPTPFQLMSDEQHPIFIAQSGLQVEEGDAPTHMAHYRAEQTEYRLEEGENTLEVPLVWTNEEGVTVTKRYIFHRDGYLIDVRHEVANESAEPWRAYQYTQLRRSPDPGGRSMFFIYTYTGGVIYSEEDRYQKISFSDMDDSRLSRTITDGWAAMIQHYFLGAWIPPREQPQHFYSRALPDNNYVLGMSSPRQTIEPGGEGVFSSQLYVGPKEQARLREIAPGLHLTVDYGFLTVISAPLFWLLERIYNLIGNWGWAIIILTLMIKLVFYKLSETSFRSMARMRKLQPKLQQLKERFGEDRQRLNQEMMELYKKEKINPLGGCLPVLVQIPVFIALYWVLLESVELRQAPFILWIQDLSVPDPFFVLPVLMGVSMLIQQKLNPAPLDPIQQKILMVLPIVFTVFFAFFPAGLVLYWVANNVLSIAQQWVITRRIEKEPGRNETKKNKA
ncbi:membrane protein insertase YidC [Alkalilimnicola ehrlichii]|uniref:Membrane protein insertase YidC n=1 Tax=Alkalilimnicola ehrlichii TaxID=351052 RepID=A0A3E0WYX5_9GAMM|nr:membrane protein insertase YidC [Alkalilimnicola ehrlichii]RFA30651.1 membrane protein insertase YidC [Alkalilimnicola ehrlichii]RFA38230.1 membrane protein insertase YidC [Alkalilimnicola ehrlichii]